MNTIKFNFLKLKKSCIMSIQGQTEAKKCVVIPIEDNHLFVGRDGVYADFTVREIKEPKYDNTHIIVQNFPKEVYNQMSEDEKKNNPIIGTMKALDISASPTSSTLPEEPPF